MKLKDKAIHCLGYGAWSGNIGDEIQSVAAMRLIERLGLKFGGLIDRDKPHASSPSNLLVNGYMLLNSFNALATAKNITPVFTNVHVSDLPPAQDELAQELKEALAPHQPIGCRDIWTADRLKSYGLEVLYNYCLSLTLEKRKKEPTNGKIFLVDMPNFFLYKLPQELRKQPIQLWGHYLYPGFSSTTKMHMAEEILNYYRDTAKMVITSRLHCALPCLAMGIPVVLFDKGMESKRLNLAKEFLPISRYMFPRPTPRPASQPARGTEIETNTRTKAQHRPTVKSRLTEVLFPPGSISRVTLSMLLSKYKKLNNIDWDPKCPDIEDTKELIRNRVKEMLRQRLGD